MPLQVMAWELLTGTQFFGDDADMGHVVSALSGEAPLTSEQELAPEMRKKLGNQAYRESLLAMLNRDPSLRPTMADVVTSWTGVFQQTSA